MRTATCVKEEEGWRKRVEEEGRGRGSRKMVEEDGRHIANTCPCRPRSMFHIYGNFLSLHISVD
jgi:hypothetical protein